MPKRRIKLVERTVIVNIGGGRNTDQIIKDAKCLKGENRIAYIDSGISQKNMPSGFGNNRISILEFFKFAEGVSSVDMEDVWKECNANYRGCPTYEDGLRFQEAFPNAQIEAPRIFLPESPWCNEKGYPMALYLWGDSKARRIDVVDEFDPDYLFARRKYMPIDIL